VTLCCGYCREKWICAVVTVENSGCVLCVLYGTVAMCCGYFMGQCVCAVSTVGISVNVLRVL